MSEWKRDTITGITKLKRHQHITEDVSQTIIVGSFLTLFIIYRHSLLINNVLCAIFLMLLLIILVTHHIKYVYNGKIAQFCKKKVKQFRSTLTEDFSELKHY